MKRDDKKVSALFCTIWSPKRSPKRPPRAPKRSPKEPHSRHRSQRAAERKTSRDLGAGGSGGRAINEVDCERLSRRQPAIHSIHHRITRRLPKKKQ